MHQTKEEYCDLGSIDYYFGQQGMKRNQQIIANINGMFDDFFFHIIQQWRIMMTYFIWDDSDKTSVETLMGILPRNKE